MKHSPMLVLEFAGESDDKSEKDDSQKEAFKSAAKKIRAADSDKEFAKYLKMFVELCMATYEEEEEED